MKRYLEYISDASSKFYEVEVDGILVHRRWGRLGTAGQTKTHSHGSDEDALAEAADLILQKCKKGYVEVGLDGPVGDDAPARTSLHERRSVTFLPMLPIDPRPYDTEASLLADDHLWAQPKVDGHHRVVYVLGDGRLLGIGRDGQVSAIPPAVALTLSEYRGPAFMLDGELLPWSGPDATLWCFDLPLGPSVTPASPLHARLDALGRLLADNDLGWAVQMVTTARGSGAKIAMRDVLQAEHGEGMVYKRSDAPYGTAKRHSAAIRWKWCHDVDCVVVELGTNKDNMTVAVYDDDTGAEVRIAEVTRLAGDGPRVRLGDVVTVKYGAASENNRLIFPTLPRIRTDKAAADCVLSQLHVRNQHAFAALQT